MAEVPLSVQEFHGGFSPPREAEAKEQVKLWEEYVAETAGTYDYVILASRWAWMFNHEPFNGLDIRKDFLVSSEVPSPNPNLMTSRKNFVAGLGRTVEAIKAAGAEPIVFGQPPMSSHAIGEALAVPRFLFSDELIAERCSFDPYEDVVGRSAFVDAILRAPESVGLPQFHALVPIDVFCDHEAEFCHKIIHGKAISDDTNHLNRWGVLHLAKQWEEQEDFPFD